MFPRIFLLETDKQCSIASRVGLIDWSSVLRRVPRGGEESSQFNALLSVIGSTSLSDQCDVWQWSLNGLSGFSVASVRHLVDSWLLDTCNDATRWNRLLPIKVNVLKLNKLPSRVNLDRRGIDVISINCPSCQGDLETVNHTFFNCGLAKELWSLLAKWWDLDIPMCGNIAEWHAWLGDLHVSSKVRLAIEGVGGTLLWSIWNFRNNLIFSSTPPKKSMIWDSVVSQSFLWISSRNPKCKISWIEQINVNLVDMANNTSDIHRAISVNENGRNYGFDHNQSASDSLSTLHFLKVLENIFEVLKLLENSVEVLKILKNKLESMKILENKLESLKLQENRPSVCDLLVLLRIISAFMVKKSIWWEFLARVFGRNIDSSVEHQMYNDSISTHPLNI
ncbi:RNA-directed DNA polymerase, eukaryota, reverse transcriptase zinc-binding domain protein [Tanacetum coccineum]|uniref:RNA-directed DNA polymerase, eukaryota, reverse transcriptase zinc-binding domain protein n=1 Tax=Tanacetum coccineum TaxID=301880 RepID=A0ABQ5F5Q8_9ASTR